MILKMEGGIVLCLILGLCSSIVSVAEAAKRPPKIAIIGGGIGGTSAAHFLRELFGANIEIDLYEPDDIGGRLATVEYGGRHYETGGSIIHPKNKYMVNFTSFLGLQKKKSGSGIKLNLYDGHQMVFESCDWTVCTMAKMLWRYGWSLFKMNNWIKRFIRDLSNIYTHQENGYAFTTVDGLLRAMSEDVRSLTQSSLRVELLKDGFSERFINELAMAANRDNYGQTTDLQGLVGSVSLAGAAPGLWAVDGGNKQVPEKLLHVSGATLVKAQVTSITFNNKDDIIRYEIQSHQKENDKTENEQIKMYDVVVVATPMHDGLSKIQFKDFQKPIHNFPQTFHTTVATFVAGKPNPKYFNGGVVNIDNSMVIFTQPDSFLNKIGIITPVDWQGANDSARIWKLFSQRPIKDEELAEIFLSHDKITAIDWLAYPDYQSKEVNMPPLLLNSQLYYVNGIELAASAMEMSAIGGRNAALLAFNQWHGHLNMIDNLLINRKRPQGEL